MSYILNLFSPETWRNFTRSGSRVSGFSRHQEAQARRSVSPDDVFLCYLVKLGRWCGALRVISGPQLDETPLFRESNDPFIVRFEVEPLIVLEPKYAIPASTAEIWNNMSWTKDIKHGSIGWGAHFQRSLREIPEDDADLLLSILKKQNKKLEEYSLSSKDLRNLTIEARVKNSEGAELTVDIPDDVLVDESSPTGEDAPAAPEGRESHRIQALLADIGAKMGFNIWIPRADRERVNVFLKDDTESKIIDILPMNYNDATVRTIEQIDMLWLRGRSIARAFEVEHTTAIYSGLLRMADLVALQPDIKIPLHIVAPTERANAVLEQIRRPVFSLLEFGPLSDRCTLISYDSVDDISNLNHLQHLRDNVIDEYEISATE